jgi:hypothetical protein
MHRVEDNSSTTPRPSSEMAQGPSRLREVFFFIIRLGLVVFFFLLGLACFHERAWISAILFNAALASVALSPSAWPTFTTRARVATCVVSFTMAVIFLPDSLIR